MKEHDDCLHVQLAHYIRYRLVFVVQILG